jgi:hypothetical protein
LAQAADVLGAAFGALLSVGVTANEDFERLQPGIEVFVVHLDLLEQPPEFALGAIYLLGRCPMAAAGLHGGLLLERDPLDAQLRVRPRTVPLALHQICDGALLDRTGTWRDAVEDREEG